MYENERAQLILEVLAVWVQDSDAADAIDVAHSYTHASCGYMDAQSHVEDVLTMTTDQLQRYLEVRNGS